MSGLRRPIKPDGSMVVVNESSVPPFAGANRASQPPAIGSDQLAAIRRGGSHAMISTVKATVRPGHRSIAW
jgi:hypothetical protein